MLERFGGGNLTCKEDLYRFFRHKDGARDSKCEWYGNTMGKGSPVPFLGIPENHAGLESPNVSSWPKILEHPGPTNLKWDVVTP